MSFCPKCGNKIDDNMIFCPHCGTPLKGTSTGQPEPSQPYEKRSSPEKKEKPAKAEQGFISYLIGGLILITFGFFSVLQLSGYFKNVVQSWAVMLLLIGIIVIAGAIYVAVGAWKRSKKRPSDKIAANN